MLSSSIFPNQNCFCDIFTYIYSKHFLYCFDCKFLFFCTVFAAISNSRASNLWQYNFIINAGLSRASLANTKQHCQNFKGHNILLILNIFKYHKIGFSSRNNSIFNEAPDLTQTSSYVTRKSN